MSSEVTGALFLLKNFQKSCTGINELIFFLIKKRIIGYWNRIF
jgi:hypothetical protein